MSPRVSVSSLVGASLLAFMGSGISACLQTKGQRQAELEQRVREILPRNARVRALGYGDCVELAPSPSCASAVFELAIPDSGDRAALVRTTATRNGWTVRSSEDLQGGWALDLKRSGFVAAVFLWRPEVYRVRCDEQSIPDKHGVCFNKVVVTRTS